MTWDEAGRIVNRIKALCPRSRWDPDQIAAWVEEIRPLDWEIAGRVIGGILRGHQSDSPPPLMPMVRAVRDEMERSRPALPEPEPAGKKQLHASWKRVVDAILGGDVPAHLADSCATLMEAGVHGDEILEAIRSNGELP